MRENLKLDNLVEMELRDEFVDFLKRRKLGVIVVGGLTTATTKLSRRVKEIVGGKQDEKLLAAFEQVLVDITNKVGVDINCAVADSYYAHLMPYICGLGPRKAQLLIKKIGALGGSLINRQQFIWSGILTTKIFLNAVAFLRIAQADIESSNLMKNQLI
jgi:hypothetical protein